MNLPAAFSLQGRVALVTGANTGLGQAMAIALAQAGADIVAIGRSDPVDTAREVTALGRGFLAIEADLGAAPDHAALIAAAVARFGRVDVLVNNAGIIHRADALEVSEADWDRVIDVNLKSVFFLSQAFARRLVEQGGGGKIVHIASMLSFQGGVRTAAYTASKSAIAGLTKLMANEWAARGINVNAIAPGYMETNNTVALRADASRNADILKRIPAGRWGQPQDLAGAVVFLASGASDYVDGIVLPVDGGWLAR